MFSAIKKEKSIQKYIILRFLILLIVTILVGCGGDNMRSMKPSFNFSEIIEYGDFDGLNLTIYYMSPFISTRQAVSIDDLVKGMFEYKVVINDNRLKQHIDLLNQINNTTLIPVKNEYRINARLYYVFETDNDGEIFNVSMWGKDNSIFINGVEVKEDDVFYDVVMSFLPDDAVQELQTYLNKVN